MLVSARPSLVALAALLLSCGKPKPLIYDNCDLSPHALELPPPPCPASCAETPPPLESGRLPETARPRSYRLVLDVDPGKPRFAGSATIIVEVPRPTRSIVLHATDLDIQRALAITGEGFRPAEVIQRRAASRTTADELVLRFDRPLRAGDVMLDITYEAPFGEGNAGLFHVREGDADYAFTQFEPSDARRAFPCFDEPSFKTSFELAVKVPKGMIALSNSAEVSREATDEGRSVLFRFGKTEPLPTYLVSLAVGPLELAEGPKVGATPIRLVTTRGKAKLGDAALSAAGKQLAFLEGYFGRSYAYKKLDLVAIPGLSAYAMEHPGLVTFREDLVLQAPGKASAAGEHEMHSVIAHELAHQWFGNLVTMPWWDDLWLNEGFATWMATKATGAIAKDELSAALAVQEKHLAMDEDELASARAVRAPVTTTTAAEELFDAITYDKGAAVVSMLESYIGPEAMRKGLSAHGAAHAHGIAASADLFAALGEASSKDVAAFASPFLDRKGVPLVRAALTCASGKTPEVKLSLDKPAAWKDVERVVVPVCVAYAGGSSPACGVLSDKLSIDLQPGGCPAWIHPNAGERGYYRFTLPPTELAALTKARGEISAAERTGLVANTRALVLRGEAKAESILALAKTYEGERHPTVISEIAESLRLLQRLRRDEGSRQKTARAAAAFFAPMGQELGWDTRAGDTAETRLARAIALEALGTIAEEKAVIEQAEARAAAYLADATRFDADTTPVALLLAATRADETRFSTLVRRLLETAEPKTRTMLARSLGAIGDAALFGRALDLALGGALSGTELVEAFLEATRRPASLPWALAWLDGHFRELRHVIDASLLLELATLVGEACDPALRDASVGFFTTAFETQGGSPKRLSMLEERANRCISAAR